MENPRDKEESEKKGEPKENEEEKWAKGMVREQARDRNTKKCIEVKAGGRKLRMAEGKQERTQRGVTK